MPEFKNIVGSAFPKYVKDQLEQRKLLLTSALSGSRQAPNSRKKKELQWLTNRTGWYRMTSGAKLGDKDTLAKNNVLQGGLIKTKDGSQTTIRKGFSATYTNLQNDDLGFIPMPGITDLSVTTGGKWQTILEAEVTFTAYNLDQLDLLSTLYMSLGVHVFIEWGHTPYLDNNGNLQTTIRPLDIFNYENKNLKIPFLPPPGRAEVLRMVSEKREQTGGNYEALLGRVYNFDYNANSDGTYSCKTKVMGPGAMAESIRINGARGYGFGFKSEDKDTEYTSDLENALFTIKQHLQLSGLQETRVEENEDLKSNIGVVSFDNGNFFEEKSFEVTVIEDNQELIKQAEILEKTPIKPVMATPLGGGFSAGAPFAAEIMRAVAKDQEKTYDRKESYAQLLNRIYKRCNYKGPVFSEKGGGSIAFVDEFAKFGNAHQLISNIGLFDTNCDGLQEIPPSLFNGYAADTLDGWLYDWGDKADMTYITLGHLMCLVQHMGIFVENPGEPQPALFIDYHPDNTIAKIGPLQCSVNPSICLVPLKISKNSAEADQVIYSKFFGSLSTSNPVQPPPFEDAKKTSKYTNDKTNLIVNPKKNVVNKSLNSIKGTNYDGKLFNILINLDYAIDCVKKLASKESKEVYLLEYVNKVLDGVNLALGKVNNFRANYVDCSHTLRIVDENIVESIPDEKLLNLPIFGLDSVAYDYSYSSKISNNLATQIVIAAQAQDAGGITDFPEEVLSYNHLNGGVKDRFSETITPPLESTKDKKKDDIETNRGYQKLFDHLQKVYSLDSETKLEKSTSSNLSILFGDIQNQAKKLNPNSNASIIIPLEFTVEMDGISGILPYNAFSIPNDRLPPRYRNRVNFAVFSINHTFNSNQWRTTLKGLTILNGKDAKGAPPDNRTCSETDRNAKELPLNNESNTSSTSYGGKITPQFQTTSDRPQEKAEPVNEIEAQEVTKVEIIEHALDARTPPPIRFKNDIIGAIEMIKTHEPRIAGVPELTAYADRDYTNDKGYTFRIGYGSDTITSTSGKVRRVKEGDKITKAEADADIRRRVTNIRRVIIRRCSDVGLNYESIPDFKVQVVFIDCAYNYGTLWYDIIRSYKNGGTNGLIAELKSRAARGKSQVPPRREAEIRYLQG